MRSKKGWRGSVKSSKAKKVKSVGLDPSTTARPAQNVRDVRCADGDLPVQPVELRVGEELADVRVLDAVAVARDRPELGVDRASDAVDLQ
jgi:hypothetical protein